MSKQHINDESEYEIVIVECCQNCESHQSYSRHSEWKYFQQFNELKKKIERFVPNAIVIKNPVPDELQKPSELKLDKNVYINKNSSEKIIYPRIGSFQIYIYNILISSKLKSNSWPNQYKVLQTLNKIVAAKKLGQSLQDFSIYNNEFQQQRQQQLSASKSPKNPKHASIQKLSPQNGRRVVSKKRKSVNPNEVNINRFRVYKSKEPKLGNQAADQTIINKRTLLESMPGNKEKFKKLSTILAQSAQGNDNVVNNRYSQSREQNRVKLPSLRKKDNPSQNKKNSAIQQSSLDEKNSRPIFNSIDDGLFDKDEMSIIEKDMETIRMLQTSHNGLQRDNHMNRFDSLILNNNEDSILGLQDNNNSKHSNSPQNRRRGSILNKNSRHKIGSQDNLSNFDDEEEQMRFLQNKSVQYSQMHQDAKQSMNRSIQWETNQEELKDFGMQIDEATAPKQITYQFVQTEKVQFQQEPLTEEQKKKRYPKLYMLDESIQANIIIRKKQKNQQIQTAKAEIAQKQINTQIKSYVNRGYQYPDEEDLNLRKMPKIQIDTTFTHLYEKRRNLPIDQCQNIYSSDRFQEKSTKYKWLGKAKEDQSFKQLKEKLYLESLVFGVYNFFGIKTPEKRLSFVQCANVLGERINTSSSALYHTLSQQNPQLQYLSQFQQLDLMQKVFPLSEELTFKTSKQKIKLNHWGKFLALMHFLDDSSAFDNYSMKNKNNHQHTKNMQSLTGDIDSPSKNQKFQDTIQSPVNKYASSIGVVITNQQVKQIYRLNCQNYQLFSSPQTKHNSSPQNEKKQGLIFLSSSHKELFIDPKRLSKSVELEFVSMLSRLTSQTTFQQLKQYLQDIFINRSKVYDEKFGKLMSSIQNYEQIEGINKSKNIHSASLKTQIMQQVKQKQPKFIKELLSTFIEKLQSRLTLIKKTYQGKIYTYRKYRSLEAMVSYNLPSQQSVELSFVIDHVAQHQNKPQTNVTSKDLIKMLRNNAQMIFLNGEQGSGKSKFIRSVKKQLDQIDRINILLINNIDKVDDYAKFVEDKFYQNKKNILFIDNIDSQRQSKRLIKLIKQIVQKQDKYDVSYFCILHDCQMFEPLTIKLNPVINKNISREQKFISLRLLPLSNDGIRIFISKAVDFKNLTQKEELSSKVTHFISKTPALKNILYLNLYCQIIEENRLDEFIKQYDHSKISKWAIMKKTFEKCEYTHKNQLQEMGVQLEAEKDVYFQLRQLVLKLFLLDQSPQSLNQFKRTQNDKYLRKEQMISKIQQYKIQLIQDFFNRFEEDKERLIKNHLQFYPIDLKFLVKLKMQKNLQEGDQKIQVKANNEGSESLLIRNHQLLIHPEYYAFLLVEAFGYYISKGFRNLKVADVTNNTGLSNLIKQKSLQEPVFCQNLLQLIYDTQLYPSLSDQASNAMTLLCHLGYQFSNLIFDHCQIQNCDLSMTTFYNCSFRNTNLMNAKIYRTSFLSCAIDATVMDNVNLLVKKYEIQFTPMCCAISHDGRQIALGCGNYLIVVATDSGKQLKKVQAHLDVIRSVKFSKDGKNLITIADDKTLRSWDTQSFRSVVFKLPQKGGAICFSNQSQTIATVVNKNDLKVWNIKSMANQALFQGHNDQITTVNFSVNGEYVITGSRDFTVRLWNLKGKQLHIYKGNQKQIICAKISPTNAIVASSSKQKQMILFHTLMESIIVKKQFLNQITQICMDLKERYIAVMFSQDQDISILNFNSLDVIHKLEGHKQRVLSICYDFNYQRLLSLSKDRTVRLWDLQQIMKKEESQFQFKTKNKTAAGSITSIAYCKKSNQYSTGHENGQINVWDDQTNTILHQMYDHHGFVSKLQYDSTGKLYSGGKDGILRIWNFDKFQQKKKQPYRKIQLFSVQLVQLKLNQKNRLIITSSYNNELVIYDFTGIKLIMSTRDEGKVNAVAFDQKDKFMAIGGAQKYIVTFKIQNGGNSLQRAQQLGQHPQTITSLAYQGDSLLISVLKSGQIYIWNHMRGTLLKKIQNISPINCLCIFNKKFACMSSEDGKIRIINLDEGKQIKVFKYKEMCNQFVARNSSSTDSSKGSIPLLYAGCKDGNVLKWSLFSVTKKLAFSSSSRSGNNSSILPSLIIQQKKGSNFARKAVNQDGTLMVQIEGQKSIKIKNLYEHSQKIIKLQKCPSILQGVEFIEHGSLQNGSNLQYPQSEYSKIMLLLKSGDYWSFSSQSVYSPSVNDNNANGLLSQNNNLQGDLFYIKQKEQLFFKSGVKKITKQIKKPTQLVIDQVTIGG